MSIGVTAITDPVFADFDISDDVLRCGRIEPECGNEAEWLGRLPCCTRPDGPFCNHCKTGFYTLQCRYCHAEVLMRDIKWRPL